MSHLNPDLAEAVKRIEKDAKIQDAEATYYMDRGLTESAQVRRLKAEGLRRAVTIIKDLAMSGKSQEVTGA